MERAFNIQNIQKMQAYDKEFFSPPWSDQSWNDVLEFSQNYWGLQCEEGFILFYFQEGEPVIHLLKILIHPHFRRQGHGEKLLKQSMAKLKAMGLKQIFLEVEVENTGARNLYLKLGGQELHLVKNFYGPNQHGLRMLIELL